MPPPVTDRYQLEMRLGRDGDIEEWLASDTSLERPVLIRSLGPESTPQRRTAFVSSISEVAKASHPHLSRVYAVEEVEGGAYAVCEWTGGATVADRVEAGQIFDLEEFLPNASGLAAALAVLHAEGGVHGALDLSAITYSVAHPAKLGAFGRVRHTDQSGDVRALGAALESALTGAPPGGPPPSERIDGVPRTIDRVLRSAQSGGISADELAKALIAAPTPRPAQPEPLSTSRRLLYVAAGLVVLAVGLVALGRVFTGGGPIIPISPTTTLGANPTTTPTTLPPTIDPPGPVTVVGFGSFDPYGEGGENDDSIGNVLDGSASTIWRTERYRDPLPLQKPGVGLRFQVQGAPSAVQLTGLSEGTAFGLLWAAEPPSGIEGWEMAVEATAEPGATLFNLPSRNNGHWMLWLTDLPEQADGSFHAELAEVRFVP